MPWYNNIIPAWITTFRFSPPDLVPPAVPWNVWLVATPLPQLSIPATTSERRTRYFSLLERNVLCPTRATGACSRRFGLCCFSTRESRRGARVVTREDMMLICMARHRHLASRYGGSTCYLVLFFVPLALFSHLFWWRGPFTGVLGAGEERNHYTGRNLFGGRGKEGIKHGRYPACWRHSLRDREEETERHGNQTRGAGTTSTTRAKSKGSRPQQGARFSRLFSGWEGLGLVRKQQEREREMMMVMGALGDP